MLVNDIVNRGGRCLIPVFALGRAQELLLILGKKDKLFYYYKLQCYYLLFMFLFKFFR